MFHSSKQSLVATGTAALALALLAISPAAAQSRQVGALSPSAQAIETLGLSGGVVGQVQVLESFAGNLLIGFESSELPMYLELAPRSVRADSFEVRVQLADGRWEVAPVQPVTTYRGTVLGEEGSRVAASYYDNGLHARIQLAGGREFWIEPAFRGANLGQGDLHAIYQTEQVLQSGSTCAADAIEQFLVPSTGVGAGGSGGQGLAGSGMSGSLGLTAGTTAELACDADYEFFQDYGSVGGTQSRIESVINTMNLQYERDVDITHAITTILVRSSPNDPYTKKPADQLLFQFRAEWNNNQSGVARDVAQLFTGRSLAGSTIGIAWVGQVCNLDLAYSVVQSDFNGNYASATDLSAHELGHNWDANHCSCTSYTMNAYITSSNLFNPAGTIPSITAYRDAQGCFGSVEPPADPTSVHVGSIVAGTQNVGQGKKVGKATVAIVTDTGTAGAGYAVQVTFTGDYNETISGTTDASGNVVLLTSATQKGNVNFTVCVDSVSGTLPYVPGDNAQTCDN